MDDEIRALLEAADDPVEVEMPASTGDADDEYEQLHGRVLRTMRTLADELGLELERDGCVQDATHHDELALYAVDPARPNVRHTRLSIRFSNFGDLATATTFGRPMVEGVEMAAIGALLARQGWTYVPAEALEAPYDGTHPGFREAGTTWWDRYFDYA